MKSMTVGQLEKVNTKLKNMDVCTHHHRKHRSKFMCYQCYFTIGNKKKASKCAHRDKPHHSRGLCQTCYQKIYFKIVNDPQLDVGQIRELVENDGQNATNTDVYEKLMDLK